MSLRKRPCSVCGRAIPIYRLTRAIYEGEDEFGGFAIYQYVCDDDLKTFPPEVYVNGLRLELVLRTP